MPSKGSVAKTPKSAAHLFNNLAANGKHLAYVAYTSVVVVPENVVISGGSAIGHSVVIDEPDGSQIQQVRWVRLASCELLVVASATSLQLHTPDGQRLLHVVTAGGAGDPGPASFRGICECATGSAEYVCAGTSTGQACLVPLAGHNAFGDSLLLPASTCPIVDLTGGPAPHNDPTRALVSSCDANGDVHVHALEADGTWGHCTTFSVDTHDGTPALCTSVRMRGTKLYSAYSTGHLRIFDLISCSLMVQVRP